MTYSGQFPDADVSKRLGAGAIDDRWTKFELQMYKNSKELKKDQLQAVRSMSQGRLPEPRNSLSPIPRISVIPPAQVFTNRLSKVNSQNVLPIT